MFVEIHCHGALRNHLPAVWRCEARTAAEAINGLTRQHKLPKPAAGKPWLLRAIGFETEMALKSPLCTQRIDLVPYFGGSGGGGSGGFLKIAIGAVLIAAAFALPGLGTVLGVSLNAMMFGMGVSLVLGGALELLSPAPKISTPTVTEQAETSKYLGAAGNTTKSGTRIPRGFGKHLVYGHYISFDVEADPSPVNGQPPRADQRRSVGSLRVTGA